MKLENAKRERKNEPTWRVQDGDADLPVGVDVGVPNLPRESHHGRIQRVIRREGERGMKTTTIIWRALRPEHHRVPLEVVVLGHRAGDEAVGRGRRELGVLVVEAFHCQATHVGAMEIGLEGR